MVMTYFTDPLRGMVGDWRVPKETLKTEPNTQHKRENMSFPARRLIHVALHTL